MPPSLSSLSNADGANVHAVFLDDLYANSAAFLERDRYSTIGDASEFFTKVVGVTFEGRQDVVGGVTEGVSLALRRDSNNRFDANAIGVWFGSLQLGFLRREIARRIAPNIDNGARYTARAASLTGGRANRSFGLNIFIQRERAKCDLSLRQGQSIYTRGDILNALLGGKALRDSQQDVLARVDAGRNTLALLGTGRGKSLCFQYPAAARAFERGEKTVVLYPLRALANDQYESLRRRLGPLGMRIHRANGSIDAGERADLFDALDGGTWDIICSTPEFLTHHIGRFAGLSLPAFVVIDEAHHLVKSHHRPAYRKLPETLRMLGSPQVLALTATADDDDFARIRESLGIDSWVIDPTVRTNLKMVDARNITNKFAYIVERVSGPGKSIVYCNSRNESVKLAEKLRARFRDVAFYHAGVPTAERGEIERMFRQNALKVVVATSAFGEGIDLPDVRNVFLYHLNFGFTEFNQQSGRAGRDGEPAEIHLLFGTADRNLNDFIIARAAPTLHTLREIYRGIMRLTTPDGIRLSYVEIADLLGMEKVDARTVSTAIHIFADEGLVTIGEDDDGRYIRLRQRDAQEPPIDLRHNARFAEGEAEREEFESFCDVILNSPPEILEACVNRPIYPDRVPFASAFA